MFLQSNTRLPENNSSRTVAISPYTILFDFFSPHLLTHSLTLWVEISSMKWVSPTKLGGAGAGGEAKAVLFKSKLKWVGLFGLVLSAFSLFTHFLLARYSVGVTVSEYKSSITIFSWRPIVEIANFPTAVM